MSQADHKLCIVIGGSIHSTLQATREIAAEGIHVWVASRQRKLLTIVAASRSCSGTFQITASDPESLALELIALVEHALPEANAVLVVTNSDRMVSLLDAGREHFDGRFTLAIPPSGAVPDLMDKSTSLRIAEHAGLDVPRWSLVADLAGISTLPTFDYPVCVRPTSWATKGANHLKIAVCDDAASLADVLHWGVEGGGRYIVQEYVGDADGLEVALVWVPPDQGEAASWTGRKRRSSSQEGGVLAYGEADAIRDVDAAIRRFATECDFRGVGGIEMLRSGQRLWFIEFNPRLEAFHKLASLSGFSGARLIAREWLGSPADPTSIARPAPAALLVWGAWWERLQQHPSHLPWFLHDLLRLLLHRHHAFAIWAVRDPLPLLICFREWARTVPRTRFGVTAE